MSGHSTIIVPRKFRPLQTADDLAREMRFQASFGVWDGARGETEYFKACRRVHLPTETQLIFTRDVGYHTSGWFKNPDYERCFHLSLSFWDFAAYPTMRTRFAVRSEIDRWVSCFFPNEQRFIWEESAHSDEGKRKGVTHFRVFCDVQWQPILPEGEVYSTLKTELGWLSWSDRVAADAAAEQAVMESLS